jgi:DNA-3-methyladenine glycosylase I
MPETSSLTRCPWAGPDPLYTRYHDEEWGVPVHDELRLFEFLVLEGAQAGLSWLTVLKKRERYRRVFDGFNPPRIARYGERKIERLLADPAIIRNRRKIESAVRNARAFLDVQREYGSFDAYVWRFVGGRPRAGFRRRSAEVPSETPESRALSKDLSRRGFSFVGPTICYAFMQAVGMVNDHLVDCFRFKEVS